ncbi:MAG: 1-deoxy-D-xylulose-5-phosphate reductoisomerase, partial [Peptococcaceae bacterium]|nr:1-deoxy-D-xylulose-5-phosphate reductoisomerase [Peptococcaceae bacterium]MBQ5668804.1 1-deoxy-D-xylulose-5-phosphate reductoisomerase [Peptococcaceae bacterium]
KCLNKILLTASGGPFRTWDKEALYQVTPAQALKHPNWSMGQKITIDSATLMNKGLEVIEANWLFGVDYDNIQVLVHPQSIIHSMVEYGDGTVLAHLGKADMRIPIQYALTWPERAANPFPKLDFTQLAGLEFFHPDYDKFPALALAFEAGRTGKSAPAVLNGANEIAVAAFLKEQIGFMDIPALVQWVVEAHNPVEAESFAHLLEIDRWARNQAELFVKKHGR